MNPICSKCQFLTGETVKFRRCPKIPIFHRDMLCSNENNIVKDHVSGDTYSPYCEEVNRYGECLFYYPVGLIKPTVLFEGTVVTVTGTQPLIVTTDGTNPSPKMKPEGEFNEGVYTLEIELEHTTLIKAACIEDGVLSEVNELICELPDVPVISFDQLTNTVTIDSYNKVFYTTDGTDVSTSSDVYEGPFVIDHNTTVKACSYVDDTLSEQVSLYCVSIEPPVIEFTPETNTVTITSDDTVLYTVDGSEVYDDSDVYSNPFVINKNTLVKAACIVNGILSDEVELECKVASEPVISFNNNTVTITGENTILYTTDGSDVKKKDTEYTGPFRITQTTTVKAKSIVDGRMSTQAELECVVQ